MHRPTVKLLTAVVGLALAQGALAQGRPGGGAGCQADPNDPSRLVCPSVGVGSIPFDLLPPGARALGVGGAFTAIADDATAAEANPAGLTQLTRPEISLHGRRTSFDLREFNGDGTYADQYNGIPTSPIPRFLKINDDTNAVSFASFVYPFENGALSFYYQNTGKIKGSVHDTALFSSLFDQFDFQNRTDVNAEALGLSGAWRVNDLFAVGASLRYARLDVKSIQSSSVNNFFDFEVGPGGQINTAGITDVLRVTRSIDDNDSDLTFNLGVLVNPGGKWSFGVTYKDGGSYTLKQGTDASLDLVVPGPNGTTAVNIHRSASTDLKAKVALPDTINFGVAFRPTDQWLFSLDAHYVRYHELPPLPSVSLLFANAAPGAQTDANGAIVPVKLSDALTYHFGAERVFIFDKGMALGLNSLALRAGIFNEKDTGGYGLTGYDRTTLARSDFDAIDTADTHYTVGLGTTFGQHVQVDLAAEFSNDTDNVVLSAIYRF